MQYFYLQFVTRALRNSLFIYFFLLQSAHWLQAALRFPVATARPLVSKKATVSGKSADAQSLSLTGVLSCSYSLEVVYTQNSGPEV